MIGGIVGAAIAGVVVLIALLGSWYMVDQTERGVLLRNGAVIGTAQPGLGFKVPLIDGVEKISVKTSTYTWDKMNSYSYDQQPADLKISVTLRASPDKVSDLYAKFGLLDTAVNQVVSPVVNQQVKVVFGRYTAVKAIQERGALNSSIKDAITDTLKYDPMIIIESVQLKISSSARIICTRSNSACWPRSRCRSCSRTPNAKKCRHRSPSPRRWRKPMPFVRKHRRMPMRRG
jgi:regulator of protease activity HflC (stomatin/prohibitin superfamily)